MPLRPDLFGTCSVIYAGKVELLNLVVNNLEDEYISILEDQEEAARYRAERKASRGRWEGGGFGVEGAIKGAMTAGAANMASGLAHSAVNAIGNIGSSISASIKKKKMFENRENINHLLLATQDAMEIAYDKIASILEEETNLAREEAKKAREDAEYLSKAFENLMIDSKEKLQELKGIAEKVETSDIREMYMDYLGKCEEMVKYQESKIGTNVDFQNGLRKELATFFYGCKSMDQKSVILNVRLPEYISWFENLFTQYTTVNGKQFEKPLDADSVYIKTVEHARSYLQYITEKNEKKKSIFGALKNGVTGIVYKNYEPDYNFITENGAKPVPEDKKEDYSEIQNMVETSDELTRRYKLEVECRTRRMSLSPEVEDTKLCASNLIVETKPLETSLVSDIMKTCCSNVSVKDIGLIAQVDAKEDA